jgi:hypothetical protein
MSPYRKDLIRRLWEAQGENHSAEARRLMAEAAQELESLSARHDPILARTFRLSAHNGLRCGFCDELIPSPSEPRKCCADGREEDERNK